MPTKVTREMMEDGNANKLLGYADITGKLEEQDADDVISDTDVQAENGYIIFKNGLIMQWGKVDLSATTEGINLIQNFPIVFPNAVFTITSSDSNFTFYSANNLNTEYALVGTNSLTTSQFSVSWSAYSPSHGFVPTDPMPYVRWFAWGH